MIFVSDEDDGSWDLAGPADYLAAFRSLKANPTHVISSDISGGEGGCVTTSANADPAPAYLELKEATGGLSLSICEASWVDKLTQLGWLADSYADTFALSAPALPESLLVSVEGLPLDSGWSFDSSLNAVVFSPEAVPANGELIEVDYSVVPECED